MDTVKALDQIEREVYKAVKEYGFKKHGRTLHRFVSEDISQVIHFQLGQAYLGATHYLVVNVGIRVPECMDYGYNAETVRKKYYHEYECNLRSRIGTVEGKEEACYDLLEQSVENVSEEIVRQVQDIVIPAFEVLSSREAILANRRAYPNFDRLSNHLILREEALIYQHLGDFAEAETKYNAYLKNLIHRAETHSTTIITRKAWVKSALELAKTADIPVSEENRIRAHVFLNC
ncbi:MAG: DUF4304 domain-containing protein [Oscillospiraceae bacterium]|nr:DUF4304 domain-containing protein [Oscillospiraceae bacterium]